MLTTEFSIGNYPVRIFASQDCFMESIGDAYHPANAGTTQKEMQLLGLSDIRNHLKAMPRLFAELVYNVNPATPLTYIDAHGIESGGHWFITERIPPSAYKFRVERLMKERSAYILFVCNDASMCPDTQHPVLFPFGLTSRDTMKPFHYKLANSVEADPQDVTSKASDFVDKMRDYEIALTGMPSGSMTTRTRKLYERYKTSILVGFGLSNLHRRP